MCFYKPSCHIICEGKSEYAYIQELLRYVRDNELNVKFTLRPYNAGGGDYNSLIEEYNKQKHTRKNDKDFIIWCDDDIYVRNDMGNKDSYDSKGNDIPNFLFNTHNFEDFLIMHLEEDILNKWIAACNIAKHFKRPLYAGGKGGYEQLLADKEIFYTKASGRQYIKGELPDIFKINSQGLENLFKRQIDKKIPFKSLFIDFLKDYLNRTDL